MPHAPHVLAAHRFATEHGLSVNQQTALTAFLREQLPPDTPSAEPYREIIERLQQPGGVSRRHDLGRGGTLRLRMSRDGDMFVQVFGASDSPRERPCAHVEFCTSQGGGRSLKTRAALLDLAKAMIEDAERYPDPK